MWCRADKPIKSDQQYQIETASDHGQFRSRLTVYDVHAADAGQFTVTAVNGFGSVTSSAPLKVQRESVVSVVDDFYSMLYTVCSKKGISRLS